MRTNTIILLESNVAVLSQLKEALSEEKGYTVVYAGDDGDEGIKQILSLKPDLVIVGMILKGTDGCGVIRMVKKTWIDAKILAMGIPNDSLIERALTEGASYYLGKPFSVGTALERIGELLKEKETKKKDDAVVKRKAVTVEEKISEYLFLLGFHRILKGMDICAKGLK